MFVQDKLTQKQHLEAHGIQVVRFMSVEDEETERAAIEVLGLPMMLKSRRWDEPQVCSEQ